MILKWIFPYSESIFCQKASANAIQSSKRLRTYTLFCYCEYSGDLFFKHLYCVPGLKQWPEIWKDVLSENLFRFLFFPVRVHTCRMFLLLEAGAILLSHLKRRNNTDTSVILSTVVKINNIWKAPWFYSDERREKLIQIPLILWSQQDLNRLLN